MKKELVALFVLLLSSGEALAGYGKTGLWELVMTTTHKKAMIRMPDFTPPPGYGKHPIITTLNGQTCTHPRQGWEHFDWNVNPSISGCRHQVLFSTDRGRAWKLVCDTSTRHTVTETRLTYSNPQHLIVTQHFLGSMDGDSYDDEETVHGVWVKQECGSILDMLGPPPFMPKIPRTIH